MKNLWLIAIGSLLMTGCIETDSAESNVSEASVVNEVISTSNEIENPPRVESPADVNLREGQEFLIANATNEDVEVLESGVQLLELIPGTGEIPTMENNVTVHYHGTLIDGTVFDSSVERAEPFTHNMSDPLIKGWVEGLLHMKTGAKYRVFMPASSGYGGGGQGAIGPNSALIFEIELLSINS
jgi:FKBP-type peptidyl-prolyl cis-trans isomerase|tara:strand:- start:1168 stop:1719 length:552 start_codon:yes stop_codon:yes gene_type:complete